MPSSRDDGAHLGAEFANGFRIHSCLGSHLHQAGLEFVHRRCISGYLEDSAINHEVLLDRISHNAVDHTQRSLLDAVARCRLWANPKPNLQVELRDEFGIICAGLPCELQLHVQLLGLANLVVQPAGQRRCRNRISNTAIAEL
jgi:hypothetical protein